MLRLGCWGALAWLGSARLLPKMAALPRPQRTAPCGDEAGGRRGLGAGGQALAMGAAGAMRGGRPGAAGAQPGRQHSRVRLLAHPTIRAVTKHRPTQGWWVTSPSPAWRQRWVDGAAPPRHGVSQPQPSLSATGLGVVCGLSASVPGEGPPHAGRGRGGLRPPDCVAPPASTTSAPAGGQAGRLPTLPAWVLARGRVWPHGEGPLGAGLSLGVLRGLPHAPVA